MNKFFNGYKYYWDKSVSRWLRTTNDMTPLSYDVWDFYYPNDFILKDEVIHHENGDSSDDRIENLQKMKDSEHRSLHMIGNHYTVGKHISEGHKQKISSAISGENHYMFGKHHSDVTKRKISSSHILDSTKVRITFCKYCNKDTEHYTSGGCRICNNKWVGR